MRIAFVFALAIALLSPCAAFAISINTVPVGNPGNPGNVDIINGVIVGAVATNYRIGATEVTNAQYVEFLNAVAASNPNGLYNGSMGFYSRGGILQSGTSGSYTYSVKPDVPGEGPDGSDYTYGDKPVVFVSWYDAARFVNWLNNGATANSPTETGAYTLANGTSVARNSGANWFLPTEDQWYKAAYHKNDGATENYWDFPTASNTAPDNNEPSIDSGNSANYYVSDFATGNASYPMTGVGAYTLSESAYNTFDQGGNVWEWTEKYTSSTQTRIRRGGAFDSTNSSDLSAAHRENFNPATEIENMGFRVATIPLLAGDYNVNGVVDGADYVLWRKNLNQSMVMPNDTTMGSVTQADYAVWRANFGQTPSGSGSGSLLQTVVPEPSTCLLLVIFVCLSMRCRIRR